MNKSDKVAVLSGGDSAERDVSLASGAAVLAALQAASVNAYAFDPAKQALSDLVKEGYTHAFIALHGRGGEDGSLQGALNSMHLPYTGSGVLASALAMDKWRTKLLWQGEGLPVPVALRLNENSAFEPVITRLGLPLFVKPASEGSSIGISKVKNAHEMHAAYQLAARYDTSVLAEQFMSGGEYTVSIVDGRALPIIRIMPANEYYDYDAKYLRNDTTYQIPSGLSETLEKQMQQLALKAAEALGCRGWCRIDIMVDDKMQPALLEANTAPGMTSHSLLPMAARAAGISFQDLVLTVLKTARYD